MLITGCFHVYRGSPLDGALFLGVGGWLAVVEARSPAPVLDSLTPAPSRRRAAGALVMLTGLLAMTPRYGVFDVLVVGGIGAGAVVLAASRADAPAPERHGAVWPYAVVGLVAALNELAAYLLATSPDVDWRHPALSDVLDPVFAWSPTRGLLVLAWLGAGLWLLRLMPARAPRTAAVPEGAQPWEPSP